MTSTHAPTPAATHPDPAHDHDHGHGRRGTRHRRPATTFLLHLGEMVVAMLLGMLLLVPVWDAVVTAAGWGAAAARPEVDALAMATTMTLGMTVWMAHRGHGTRAIAEMALAMVVPFGVALVPYWAGAASGADALVAGHVLMLPAMVGAMLLRRREYTAPHVHAAPTRARRVVDAVAHRWPTLLALGLTFDSWLHPGVPSPWLLVALGAEYLVIGAARRQFRRDRLLAAHVAGLVVYLALAGVAATAPAGLAGYVVAAGWLVHVGWDVALHRADRVTWRWYAEACIVIDLVIGVTVLWAM